MTQTQNPNLLFDKIREEVAIAEKNAEEERERLNKLRKEEQDRENAIREAKRKKAQDKFLRKVYGLDSEQIEMLAPYNLGDLAEKWPMRKRLFSDKKVAQYRERGFYLVCSYHHPARLSNYGGHRRHAICDICHLAICMIEIMKKKGSMRKGTVHDYNRWMTGYIVNGYNRWMAGYAKPGVKINGGNSRFFNKKHLLVAEKSFDLFPVEAFFIIALPGVEVRYLDQIGKGTTVLLMDGFRVYGDESEVIVYEDTYDPDDPEYEAKMKEATPWRYD